MNTMRYRLYGTLGIIFFVVLGWNCLMPLTLGGDDYVYAFIWDMPSEFDPLPEDAQRVEDFSGLLASQWSHYLNRGGRTIAHVLAQCFIWQGKGFFNICNALITMLLLLEIHWLTQWGKVSSSLKWQWHWWFFFALWAFTPGFPAVFLWLTGACNYLWAAVILLGFMLPYVHYLFQGGNNSWAFRHPYLMFAGGIMAGWTNENNVPIVLLLIAYGGWQAHKQKDGNALLWGAAGMAIGFALLMLAPGNSVRMTADLAVGLSSSWQERLMNTSLIFVTVLFYQLFMWYFYFRVMLGKKRFGDSPEVQKTLNFARLFGLMSLLTNGIMMLSPEYPYRAAFVSGIFLLVAVTRLWTLQELTGEVVMKRGARGFVGMLGTAYCLVTLFFTFYGLAAQKDYEEQVMAAIAAEKQAGNQQVVEVPVFQPPEWLDMASTLHLPIIPLDDKADGWVNMALARYYGIKGIKAVSGE